jgi:sRNA-binding carbon storage regulator CsrA
MRVGETTVLTMPDGTRVDVKIMLGGTSVCKIGIDAPLSVRILRGEKWEEEVRRDVSAVEEVP